MSIFALATLGLVFGWLLCLFSLLFTKPNVIYFLQFVFDSEWRCPTAADAEIARLRRRELMDEGSASSTQRRASIRLWFGVVVFGVTATLIIIELLQNFRSAQAAAIENIVTEPRIAALVLASAFGFAARLFQREIAAGIETMSQIALVGGSGGAQEKKENLSGEDASNTAINYVDARFPWYVEIGVLLSIVLVAIFWINPQLLRNLTSFKAAGVEAHFATVTGSATVQSGLIVTVDPARKTVSQGWAAFAYPDEKDARFDTYREENMDQMKDAASFFDSYVKPAFVFVNEVNTKKTTARSGIDDDLKKLAVELSRIVRSGGEDIQYRETALNANLLKLCEDFLSIDTGKPCRFKEKIDSKFMNRRYWDPYIIQAVGDLLLVLEKRKEQEDFLITTTGGEAGKDICPAGCRTAGQLSLMYDVVLAKVRSSRPWPFEDTLKQLSDALEGVDLVLDRNEARWARNQTAPQPNVECLCEKTNSLFRKNRFMDLALGLELFYQRDLQGQHFRRPQMQIWRDWLAETRAVVETLDESIVAWPPPFSDDVRKSWLRARVDIRSRPDMLQDAYVGIALSLVLIGSTEGDVSERDCNDARGFLARAESGLPHYVDFTHLDADDKATYRGFLEQVNTSVDSRCKL